MGGPRAQAHPEAITAPATLGVLGGGQLGRFFVTAAHELGYDVWVLDPDPGSPAGRIADRHLVADYDDPAEAAAWLRGALDAVLDGRTPDPAETEPVGCSVKWSQ